MKIFLKYIIPFSLCLTAISNGAQDWSLYVTTRPAVQEIRVPAQTGNSIAVAVDINTGIAITPDGTKAIFGNISGSVTIVHLTDLSTTVLGPFFTASFSDVAISPDGSKAYLTDAADRIVVINMQTEMFQGIIPLILNSDPVGVIFTPDGTRAYVTNSNLNSVSVIDVMAGAIIGMSIPVGMGPQGIAITPDGSTVYVANRLDDSVSVISTATNTVIDTIITGPNSGTPTLFDVAINPDGTKAYVTSEFPSGRFITIDVATNTVEGTLGLSSLPRFIAITPDGLLGYVANNANNNIAFINFAQNKVVNLGTPQGPFGVAMTPDQAPIAAFTAITAPPGSPSSFDASDSMPSPFSPAFVTIDSYDWDFGDGTLVTTTSPTITHTYAVAGNYTVTLVVTNSAGTSTTQTFTGNTVSNNGGPSARFSLPITIVPIPVPPPIIVVGEPRHLRGQQEKNKFLTQTDISNVLRWDTPATGTPNSYRIYRNSLTNLIAELRGNVRQYSDHNREPGVSYTYFVVAVDAAGNTSVPAVVTVR